MKCYKNMGIFSSTYSVQRIHKRIAESHNRFYKSRQQMLHVSVITDRHQALSTWCLKTQSVCILNV
jgi:hypothetical protein